MKFVHTQKFLRVSPRKMREVVRMIKGLTPEKAIEVLPHLEKKAAIPVLKTLKTTVANASGKGVDKTQLIIKEIQVNEGPRLKRYRAGARGRAKPYKRRMSHLKIMLEGIENKKIKSAKTVKKEVKIVEKKAKKARKK